jgi:cysteinyl-tRNA synthetase
MLSLTKKLIDKGYGYEMDGSVYFSINKFPEYGNLSGIDLNSVKHGVRYSADEYTKEDVRDFVLWKAGKENENIFWECEYGKGRPGWHLECSAMIHEIFNRPIDIHTGGVDLLFPHHENEIAQSVNAYEHPFVKYWMHCEHLLVDGKKMSKSDGNFFTIQDLIKENIHPLAIRYFLMSSHYRQKLNFTREAIQQTSQTIRKIWNFYLRLTSAIAKGVVSDKEKALHPQMESWKSKFLEELQDDLNTPRALAVFHDAIRESNYLLDEQKDILSNETKTKLVAVFQRMDSVLGILSGSETIAAQDREGLPEDLQRLLDQRNQARKDKDFVSADRFRDQIQSRGYEILDTQDGTRLLKKT